MLEVDSGKYGAKRQSLERANPRDVLKTLVETSPNKSEDDIREECWHKLRTRHALLRTIYEYWFTNNFRSVIRSTGTGSMSPQAQAQTRALQSNIIRQIEDKIDTEVNIRLLNLIMPSGKTLGNSTREELIKVGGWVTKISVKLQPGQTVLEARITEQQLLKLYR